MTYVKFIAIRQPTLLLLNKAKQKLLEENLETQQITDVRTIHAVLEHYVLGAISCQKKTLHQQKKKK